MTEQPGSVHLGAPDVGLYLDDERAVAAVSHPVATGPSLHLASLHPTVLHTHSDGTVSLGDTPDDQSESYTDFLGSLGDGVGVTGSRGTVMPAEQLTSMSLLCLLTEVASSIDLEPRDLAAAATYPADWTAEQVFALRSAMNAHGLAHVSLVAEAEALAAWNASVRATLGKKDRAVAAARGAAILAAEFPVDAVTERFATYVPPRPDRRPLLAASAFAAVLTVGAVLIALQLGTSAETTVPTLDNAQLIAPPTSPRTAPGGPIDFPTAVVEPAAEIAPVAPVAPNTPEQTGTTTTTEPSEDRRVERDPTQIDTHPAIESPEESETTRPPAVVAPADPDQEVPVEEPTDEPSDSPEPSPTDEQPESGQDPAARVGADPTAPTDRSTGATP